LPSGTPQKGGPGDSQKERPTGLDIIGCHRPFHKKLKVRIKSGAFKGQTRKLAVGGEFRLQLPLYVIQAV